MTATFTITDPELEAIRSVERYMAVQLHNGHQPPQPVENDLNTLSGLLERLAPAPPPVEEVASRPDGEPTAGSPIGIVRDHPSHDEDLSTKHLIIWSLLPLAKVPNAVANLVKDAVHGDLDEQCRAALAAVDAIARLRRDLDAEIPF